MKLFSQTSGWIVSLMGLFFLFSWHLDLTSFLQCSLCPRPLPYATGLCLFLSGLALIYRSSSLKLPICNILGCLIFFTAFAKGAELLLPADSKLNLLLNEIHIFPFQSSRMVLTSAFAFALIGMVFIFWQKEMRDSIRNIFFLLVAGSLIFLGSSVIFIDLLAVEVSLQMQKSLMHLYAAVGLLIIGLGFIAGRSLNPNLSE